ncbi:MAG: protein kinase [Gemmatimonadales bacterium]
MIPAALQQALAPRYLLRRPLGGGSMAVVYLGDDVRHGRPVAVKCLRPEYGATLGAERFLREIEIAAQLQHPHIVPLLDSGDADGVLYLVMPYVEGESLRVRLVREGRLAPADVIRIMGDVADALAHAHARGIVHRDIKPDNILLAGRHALVADFGVARAVRDATIAPKELTIGVALGTPAYMAPEQATASPHVDERADLYALGVVAYELLTGKTPFDRPTAQAMLTAQVLEAPVSLAERRPDVSPALAAVVMRCLAKAPEDRFQSATELGRHLEPLLTPTGGITPMSLPPVATRRSLRPLSAGVVLALLSVAAAAAVVARRPAAIGMTGVQRQVTFGGLVRGAAISPDGELLAFIEDSGGVHRLMLQDNRGGQAIQLSEGTRLDYPSWSGDGAEIRCFVFDTTGMKLRRIPRLGGAARDLPAPMWAALSPTGDRLASVRQADGRLTIRNLSTGDTTVVAGEAGWWYSLPTWSQDGRQLAWAEMDQSGRQVRLRTASADKPEPRIVYQDSVSLGVPTWGEGGKALFLFRTRGRVVDLVRLPLGHDGTASGVDVIRAGLSSGSPETFMPFPPAPSLSADGRRLAYVQQQVWSNLAVADLDPAVPMPNLRMLTTGSGSFEFARLSPDGRWLAAERVESEDISLQLVPVEGGTARELGRMSELGGLAWSPKSDRVLVTDIRGPAGRGLSLWQVGGAPLRHFAAGKVGESLDWLTDSVVVVSRTGNRSLQVIRVGDSLAAPLPGIDTTGWMFWPRLAPDRKTIAFVWNRGQLWQGVYLLEPGRPAREIYHGIMNPAGWSPDGRILYVVDAGFYGAESRVFAVDIRSGATRLLGAFTRGTEITDVTSDGRRAYVIHHEGRADAWTLDFASHR